MPSSSGHTNECCRAFFRMSENTLICCPRLRRYSTGTVTALAISNRFSRTASFWRRRSGRTVSLTAYRAMSARSLEDTRNLRKISEGGRSSLASPRNFLDTLSRLYDSSLCSRRMCCRRSIWRTPGVCAIVKLFWPYAALLSENSLGSPPPSTARPSALRSTSGSPETSSTSTACRPRTYFQSNWWPLYETRMSTFSRRSRSAHSANSSGSVATLVISAPSTSSVSSSATTVFR